MQMLVIPCKRPCAFANYTLNEVNIISLFLEVSLKTLLFSSFKLIISLLVSKPRDLHMSEKTIEISNCFLKCLVYLKLNLTICALLLCMFHQCKDKKKCLSLTFHWNEITTWLWFFTEIIISMHWYKGQWCYALIY